MAKGKKAAGGPVRGAMSQAIRDQLALDGSASPKTIQAALKEKGIEVSVGLISAIKYGGKNKGAGKKVPGKRGRKPAAGSLTIDDLKHAKELADRLGGVDAAIALLNTLASCADDRL
jgi:hypothetical protein